MSFLLDTDICSAYMRGNGLVNNSGANLIQAEKQAAFLVGIFTVDRVIENPRDDPALEGDECRYRVLTEMSRRSPPAPTRCARCYGMPGRV